MATRSKAASAANLAKTTTKATAAAKVTRRALLDNGEASIVPNPTAAATMKALLDDDLVQVNAPKAFTLTLDDGRPVHVNAGVQNMPRYMANHWWSKVQGVEEFTPPSVK